MAITLTTPIDRGSINQQAIVELAFQVPHVRDDVTGEMKIDKENTFARYTVRTFTDTGESLAVATRSVPFANWPPVFVAAARDVYALAEQDAQNAGLIDDGTAEALE